ncbi:MAG: sigma-70 family RNA polymerase sigma factor [Bacteroidales bacterium]|nr:sigma-70 family RNA polymerase sigma factor [Bacteroidales bacterium]
MKAPDFWTRKYEQNMGKMIGICHRYVSDFQEAEDLAHDAFLQCVEKADSFKGLGNFDAWMMRVTVNTALQHLRKSQHFIHLDTIHIEFDVAEDDLEPEELARYNFSEAEILEAIQSLPTPQRTVFNLYVFERYPHRKIATELGIGERTSKLRLAQARHQLQHILSQKKNKKTLLMIPFFAIFGNGYAIDHLCRSSLKNYSVAASNPLNTDFEAQAEPSPVKGHAARSSATLSDLLVFALVAAILAMLILLVARTFPHGKTPEGPAVAAPDSTQTDSVYYPEEPTTGYPVGDKSAKNASTSPKKKASPDTVYKTVVKVVHDTIIKEQSTPTVNQNAMFKGGSGSGIGTGTGSGLGPGEGSGIGGGIGYGTGSRGLVKQINTEVSEEGQVAVEVHVMADGTVSEAHIVNNSKGRTTITNTYIQQQCIREAKKAKYKPGKEEFRIILFK